MSYTLRTTIRKGALACALLLHTFFLVAQVPQGRLFFSGDREFETLRYLATLSGTVTLGTASPATLGELRTAALAVDPSQLDAMSLSLLDTLGLGAGSDSLTAGKRTESGKAFFYWMPRLSVDARLRPPSASLLNADQTRIYNGNKSALSIPVLFGFGENLAAYTDFTLQQNWWTAIDGNSLTNIPLEADDFDMTVPARATLSWANDFASVAIGRGPLSAGDTLLGNMVLSDGSDRLNFASLSLYSPNFKISFLPVELAPDRYVYFHDISFRPRHNIAITFSEAASVNSTLDLRYLNPIMIYHSYAGWRDDYDVEEGSPVGTQFALKIEAVPVKGLRCFGQFVMNQFQLAWETQGGGDADSIPNAFGGMAGVEYVRRAKQGFFSIYVEAMYSNPWLYIMDTESISYSWTRKDLVAPSGYGGKTIQGWLGSPFGPDTAAVAIRLKYDEPAKRSYGFLYRFTSQGDNGYDYYKWYYGGLGVDTSAEDDKFYPTASNYDGDPDGDTQVYQHLAQLFWEENLGERIEIEVILGYIFLYGSSDSMAPYMSSSITYRLK